MLIISPQIEIDGELRKELIIDVRKDGHVRVVGSLSELPCEPANTRYVPDKIVVMQGQLISPQHLIVFVHQADA